MKFIPVFFMAALFFSSCKQSAVRLSFSAADSLVVHFTDDRTGAVIRTVEATDARAIRRVIEFMDAKETQQFKCGYDGKMIFYSKGEKMQEADFKMKDPECNHFIFLLNGELHSTRMSNEAVNFFNALEKGLPQYW
jgi:hypothetical protein